MMAKIAESVYGRALRADEGCAGRRMTRGLGSEPKTADEALDATGRGAREARMAEETRGDALAADLVARVEALPALVNGDPWLVRRGRFLDVEILLELGRARYRLAIERGRIAALERSGTPMPSWRFAVRAGEEAWRRFWQPVPAPHYHDILAMAKRGELSIEGDLHPFMANLLYIKDVLAAPRRAQGGA